MIGKLAILIATAIICAVLINTAWHDHLKRQIEVHYGVYEQLKP